MYDPDVPGANGSLGPLTDDECCQPHVYARDVNSGAGNCVCGAALGDELHTEAAPGVPVPDGVIRMVGKSAEPQRFVLGIAYQAGPDPRIQRGVDGGRDYFTKAELEKACWSFMRGGRPEMNAFHVDGTEDCAEPVESFIWRWPDWDAGDGIVVKDGDWCLGAILTPRLWALHKAGKVNGLSPEGTARRRRVAKEGAVAIAKGSAGMDGDEDEFTELVDANFSKVALVGAGANGVPRFLISKQDGATGLLDPDFVRGLIAKSPEPSREVTMPTTLPNGITVTGSPADVAAFIHKAAQKAAGEAVETVKAARDYEAVIKAKYSTEDRKKMAGSGAAMKDGSYPIADEADLKNAIHAVGRGGGSHDAIRKHIITRAKSIGKSSLIPDNWGADGSIKESVSKDALTPDPDDGIDGLDPTVPFAAPDDLGDIPGDPTDPGSPAWEAIDAATAGKWLSILARAQNAIELLSDREALEAATVDPDDAESACDLQDAACALDYVIGQLAVFAAGEQAEADLAAEAMEQIGKAAAGAVAPLGVIETLAAVRKAGRVLSSSNEAAIRGAVESLQKVLASLPEAPVAKSKEGAVSGTQTAGAPAQAVAKETASPEEQAADTGPVDAGGTTGMGEPRTTGPAPSLPGDGPQRTLPGDIPGRAVVKAALKVVVYDRAGRACKTDPAVIRSEIAKADGDGEGKTTMQAVFDENGNLVGIVDPADITPVAGAGGNQDDGDDDGDDGDGMQDGPAAAAAPDADDMTPQPSADAGTPAEDVAKSGAGPDGTITVTQDVLKSIVGEAVAAALGALAPAEDVAKSAVAAVGEEVETLKARLAVVEEQPAMPKVFTNGAVPPAHMLRGQDQGAPLGGIDVAKAAERKRELYQAPDASRQNEVAKEMQGDAIAALAAIRRR